MSLRRTTGNSPVVCVLIAVLTIAAPARPGHAQEPTGSPLDAIRGLSAISPVDQQQIRGWFRGQVDTLAQSKQPDRLSVFRQAVAAERSHGGNTDAFVRALASAAAAEAEARFVDAELDPTVAWGLAWVLRELNRVERVPGLLAGLSSRLAHVRVLCANALTEQIDEIAPDNNQRERVIGALRDAGERETDPVARGRIYRALAYRQHVGDVFDVYLAMLDMHLDARRQHGGTVSCAEAEALEFLREVVGQLTAAQQAELVKRLAVLLRVDMERYVVRFAGVNMETREQYCIERRVLTAEEILAAITNAPEVISNGGLLGSDVPENAARAEELRATLLSQLSAWVGDAGAGRPGALNDARWGVEVGAP